MRKPLFTTLLAVTLLTLSTACSPEDNEGYKRPKVWPKPVDPPPASPIYHDVDEKMPTEEEIEREAQQRPAALEAEIERALGEGDAIRLETVFVYVFPELLQVEPKRLMDLHARLAPGRARDLLRKEMALQWAASDPPAAMRWIQTLEKEEQHEAAVTAVNTLAPWEPRIALQLAEQFDLGEAVRKRLLAIEPREPEAAAN